MIAIYGGLVVAALVLAKAWVKAEIAKLEKDVRDSFAEAQADIHETIDRVESLEHQRLVRFITNGGNA